LQYRKGLQKKVESYNATLSELSGEQRRKWKAARVIQSGFRGYLARKEAMRIKNAGSFIRRVARGWLVRRRKQYYITRKEIASTTPIFISTLIIKLKLNRTNLLFYNKFTERRIVHAKWLAVRNEIRATLPVQGEILRCYNFVDAELRRVAREATAEVRRQYFQVTLYCLHDVNMPMHFILSCFLRLVLLTLRGLTTSASRHARN